ncbi:MAG TPA: protein kinase, partial [Kofleriaceae bacterium]|nr:protein kinase [Kofleriaceae bacterium]
GEYFFAMEYVHGEDVRKILSCAARQRTHVPLGYAVAIVSAAAAGLNYAHERRGADKQPLNIVHRDVSPSNILVGYDGSIKVVDFGVASASMHQETRSGSLKGKLSYMSPEQCRGAAVDRRSDVYALGVVLYELATTTRMIKGENDYLVMEQIVQGRIQPPQLRRPGLPSELTDIIMRALAADRDRRYSSADELRLALDQFAGSAALTASTSAIAMYMRQQFGQRPEPWLELDRQPPSPPDDVPTSMLEESLPSNSWTESPRSDRSVRSTSDLHRESLSLPPPQSGQLGVIVTELAAEATVRNGPPHQPVDVPRPTAASPEPRLPWHVPARAAGPRQFPTQKVAIAGGVLLGAIGIWLMSGHGGNPATPPAPAVAALQVAPPPAAAVPPPMPTAPPPDAADAPPADASVATTRRDTDPPVRKPRAAAAAIARTPNRSAVEVAGPPPKIERPTRSAVVATLDPPASSGAGSAEPELHRPAAAPPPPPPTPAVTPPAVAAAIQPPAPAPPAAPQVIAPNALDANRISGDKSIVPDEATQGAIGRSGTDKLVGSYKLCVTAEGAISTVAMLKSTGFPAYDEKIAATIRRDWRFRPFVANGKPTAVCTAIRFMYSQK